MARTHRYQQIKQHLLLQIRSGAYPAEHRIPPEERIAEQFGVSRMTANKAIRDLVQGGYLTRRAGVGTFVTGLRAESSLVEIHNIADEVRQRGHAHSCRVVCAESCAADASMAGNLEIESGSEVFHTTLVHHENDIPIQIEDRYVNPHWVPDYLATDFTQHTPNEVLVAACPISRLEHTVEAVLPVGTVAAWLDIPATAPCLRMTRRTWSGDGLISYARLTYPGDRYKLRSSARTGG